MSWSVEGNPEVSMRGYFESIMKLIREIGENEPVESYAQVRSKQLRFKKNGEPYLQLLLADRSGRIDAKVWDDVDNCRTQIQDGDFVKYQGVIQLYNDTRQMLIKRIRKVCPDDRNNGFKESDLVPHSESNIDEMWSRLQELVTSNTQRPCVLRLLVQILENHKDEIKTYPAGTEIHHDYWGGFLEHVLSVLETLIYFSGKYPALDRDLLVAGAILHDIGKLQELSNPENPSYTIRGNLIGHVVLGRDMLREEAAQIPDFPPDLLLLLEHLIISHQGQPEWGSPKRPQIPEALVLHYCDDLDAKMNRFYKLLKEDTRESSFTGYDRYLGRVIFKTEPAHPRESE